MSDRWSSADHGMRLGGSKSFTDSLFTPLFAAELFWIYWMNSKKCLLIWLSCISLPSFPQIPVSVVIHLMVFFQLTCSSCSLAHFSNSELGWNDIFKPQIEQNQCSLQDGRLVFTGVRARCRPDSYLHPWMSSVFIFMRLHFWSHLQWKLVVFSFPLS